MTRLQLLSGCTVLERENAIAPFGEVAKVI
jgi:hypothetical protein